MNKNPNIARKQGCARGLFSGDRGETETLKAGYEALTIQAKARPRPRPSELETKKISAQFNNHSTGEDCERTQRQIIPEPSQWYAIRSQR